MCSLSQLISLSLSFDISLFVPRFTWLASPRYAERSVIYP